MMVKCNRERGETDTLKVTNLVRALHAGYIHTGVCQIAVIVEDYLTLEMSNQTQLLCSLTK